jgi:hypothetical protein
MNEYMVLFPKTGDELKRDLTRWPTLGYRVVAMTENQNHYTVVLERPRSQT